jgi:hypothetical protein
MINWIKGKIEDRKRADHAAAKARLDRQIQLRAKQKEELKELRLITIQNRMYLTSSINVYTSVVNSIKGRNGAETKRRKEFMNKRIQWMTVKLEEETAMISYYDQRLSAL